MISDKTVATLESHLAYVRRCSVTFKLEPPCTEMKLSCNKVRLRNKRSTFFTRTSTGQKSIKFYTSTLPQSGVISSKIMKVLYRGTRLSQLKCSVMCTSVL